MFLRFYDQNSLHVHIVGTSVRGNSKFQHNIQCKMDLLGLHFFMKQVNFLNKIVTSYFEHNIKTFFCTSVKLCTV